MPVKTSHLILFFTYGISLKNWSESGFLHREIFFYKGLCEKGIKVTFITYGDEADYQYQPELGEIRIVPYYAFFKVPKSKLLRFFHSFLLPLVLKKPLQQGTIYKTNQIWGGWVAVFAKWSFRKPLIVRCGYDFYDFSRKQGRSKIFQIFAYLTSRLIYSQANKIHVASSSDFKLVKKEFGIPSSLIDLSPNWIDIQLFKPLPVKKDSRVLFVGRLNVQKNLSLLLNALKNTGIELDVVGNGELREGLIHLAKELGVKVNFLGMIPNENMPAVYNRYMVYVLCSDYEGNPKTMLEAMACSCAVVGTNVPGIQGILQHKKNGILVQRNPEALREAIQCLFGNAPLRKKLGESAFQYINMNNSLEVALKKEYAVYQQLCKN